MNLATWSGPLLVVFAGSVMWCTSHSVVGAIGSSLVVAAGIVLLLIRALSRPYSKPVDWDEWCQIKAEERCRGL